MRARSLILFLLVAVSFLLLTDDIHAGPGITTRVSVASDGAEGNNGSRFPAMSGNGRFVAFSSFASNLVPGDIGGFADVFVRDLQANTTVIVSVNSIGARGNGESYTRTAISADGRFVAFDSIASNLVAGDTNTCPFYVSPGTCPDVFLHDRDTDTDGVFDEAGAIATIRVSEPTGGGQSNGASSQPAVSADGRFVAFESLASNLVLGDNNDFCDTNYDNIFTDNCPDIFVHDRLTATTTRVSVDSNGSQASGFSSQAGISGDGRWIGFNSSAADLAANDTNAVQDVFLHDRQTGATSRISVNGVGEQGNGPSGFGPPSLNFDGRFVAFESSASNLVAGDTNTCSIIPTLGGCPDVFVHYRPLGTTTRISVDTGGAQANDASGWVGQGEGIPRVISIDGSGRYVAFTSMASNLVALDTNGKSDVFIRDQQTATTTRVSVATNGSQANGLNDFDVSLSSGGRRIVFESLASNLVVGDSNNTFDAFVHDLGDLDGDGEWDPFDPDADGDGVTNAAEGDCGDALDQDSDGAMNDGCPPVGASSEEGIDQCMNAVDDDGDGWINDGCIGVCVIGPGPPPPCERPICGSGALNPASRPERLDSVFDNLDDDGDGLVDEVLPLGSEAFDCDGDGWLGAEESLIFNAFDPPPNTRHDQDPCGNNGWPADLIGDNKLNIADFTSFLFPTGVHADSHGGWHYFNHHTTDNPAWNVHRWDLVPDGVINIADINRLNPGVNAPPSRPPMFGGRPAFFTNLGQCPWPP